MKALFFAAATLAVFAAAPALAQPLNFNGITSYGTLGLGDYNSSNGNGADSNFGAVTARLGARFGPYIGIEGELSGGFNDAHPDIGGTRSIANLRDQYAAYAVGFLPILPNADLLARIGYGASDLHVNQPLHSAFNVYDTSWNAGVGGQYFVDGQNGVRVDYTRETADRSDLDANVFSLAYVRKF